MGKLFFAIAWADRDMNPNEVFALKKLVKEEWRQADEEVDAHGSEVVYQIEIVFDWLMEQDFVPYNCLEDFKDYHRTHKDMFSAEVNQMIWKTANAIALSFASMNKSELIALNQLKHILQS